jgi:hypothetical protein
MRNIFCLDLGKKSGLEYAEFRGIWDLPEEGGESGARAIDGGLAGSCRMGHRRKL